MAGVPVGKKFALEVISAVLHLLEVTTSDPVIFGNQELDPSWRLAEGPAYKTGALGTLVVLGYIQEHRSGDRRGVEYRASRQSLRRLKREFESRNPRFCER